MPSNPTALAELPAIISEFQRSGAESVVDVGCGRLRNSLTLARLFRSVYLAEDPSVLNKVDVAEKLRRLRRFRSFRGAFSLADFGHLSLGADAALLAFVLHIIPRVSERRLLLQKIHKNLRAGGLLAVVVPGRDVKYLPRLRSYPRWNDGIKVAHAKNAFGFYKQYDAEELTAFLKAEGFRLVKKLQANHRYIQVAEKT